MISVFITRELKPDSPLLTLGKHGKFSITGHSLLQFEKIVFAPLPKTDWIFFYSSNAVRFFMEQVAIPLGVEVGCMGTGTAETLRQFGVEPRFIGNGKPEETALNFLEHCQGGRVLFPRAKHSKQSIQKLLRGKIIDIDLVAYSNTKKKIFRRPVCDIIIFTSPLNAEAFFDLYNYDKEIIIAIGTTTRSYISRKGIEKILVPQTADEAGLKELLSSPEIEWS